MGVRDRQGQCANRLLIVNGIESHAFSANNL
jgi:hypothetical protein